MTDNDRLAVLFDADNVSHSNAGGILTEISKLGTASVKRVYGDWTQQASAKWRQQCLDHALQPVQQYAYTTGKNATDSALIIDAMDLLYTGRFAGFCIVSSDSDFTRLATRIRENGLTVYGFGEKKTPMAFVKACDQFVYVEVLAGAKPGTVLPPHDGSTSAPEPHPIKKTPKASASGAPTAKNSSPISSGVVASVSDSATAADTTSSALDQSTQAPGAPARVRPTPTSEIVELLQQSVKLATGEDGWAYIAQVGNVVRRQQPGFDSRLWGYDKLANLFLAVGGVEFEVNEGGPRNRLRLTAESDET